jgi:hypothetical protein
MAEERSRRRLKARRIAAEKMIDAWASVAADKLAGALAGRAEVVTLRRRRALFLS